MDRLSNAQQIKELYKELLADSQEHTRIELFAYAQQKSGGRFTDGMLTGALRTLVTDTNDYICVRRGCYKKKSTEEQAREHNSLVEAYLDIFKEALRKSGNITSNPFQILNMNREDIAKLEDIEKCVRVISDTIEKIQQTHYLVEYS